MSVSARLFCLDTVMIDIVLRITEIPERGSDVMASEHLITTGGGYNAMSSAARQGVSALYAGRLGSGPFSSIARTSLERDDIVEPFEADESRDAGFCVALIDDGGERTFVTSPGAEGSLRFSDLSSLDIKDGDYVLLSGYNVMYPDSAPMILEWLGSLSDDVVVAFDPSNRVADIPGENLQRVLTRSDWTLCNETEASLLTGKDSIVESAVALRERTGRDVVLRHGPSGCTVLRGSLEPVLVAGFDTRVVDTNGAGDTHSGVFLAELMRGTDVIEAAERGNAAAAVAISVLGPASCPDREVISAMIRRSSK